MFRDLARCRLLPLRHLAQHPSRPCLLRDLVRYELCLVRSGRRARCLGTGAARRNLRGPGCLGMVRMADSGRSVTLDVTLRVQSAAAATHRHNRRSAGLHSDKPLRDRPAPCPSADLCWRGTGRTIGPGAPRWQRISVQARRRYVPASVSPSRWRDPPPARAWTRSAGWRTPDRSRAVRSPHGWSGNRRPGR